MRGTINQLSWKLPQRATAPIELMSADQIEAVHLASLSILRDTGVQFFSAATRDFLKPQHGVAVNATARGSDRRHSTG